MDLTQFLTHNQTVLMLLVLWTLPWKGVALWKASQLKQKWWFVVLLVVNTVGILEILYIFVFSKKQLNNSSDRLES